MPVCFLIYSAYPFLFCLFVVVLNVYSIHYFITINILCFIVYCTICLTAHRMTEIGQWNAQPFFYVNIADMDTLNSEKAYVACKSLHLDFAT